MYSRTVVSSIAAVRCFNGDSLDHVNLDREGRMDAQGLLVKAQNGQDLLLTTEPRAGNNTYRLAVFQRVNGTWEPVTGIHESAFRESLIGAFVDFFVDICRVLNSSSLNGLGKSDAKKRAVVSRKRVA